MDDDGNPVDKDGNMVAAKYRKRGLEKNHRPDPIVEMGLLMDKNGIPLAFDLFPENESEKVHMCAIINRTTCFTYFDDVLNSCEKAFNIELSNRYRTRQIQRLLKY